MTTSSGIGQPGRQTRTFRSLELSMPGISDPAEAGSRFA